jgi:hypothetical protein
LLQNLLQHFKIPESQQFVLNLQKENNAFQVMSEWLLLYLHFVIATGNLVSQYCVKSSLHLSLSPPYLSTNPLSRSFGLYNFSCYSLEFTCQKDILALRLSMDRAIPLPSTIGCLAYKRTAFTYYLVNLHSLNRCGN